MLIILGGLPGVGKTTIAKLLAKKLQAAYLRIDSIEQAIRNAVFYNEAGGVKEVEIICSDQLIHQHRVENRKPNITGHKLPTWQGVLQRDYAAWESKSLQIDTAKLSPNDAVDLIYTKLIKIN